MGDKLNNTQRQALRNQAYELRLSGMTYREIGTRLGISHVTAFNWITEHLADETLPLVDEVRKMEYDRMMRIIERNEEKAIEGDDKALAMMLKTSESLRKMLGADMPTRTETTHIEATPLDASIQSLLDEMADRNAVAKRIAANKGMSDSEVGNE